MAPSVQSPKSGARRSPAPTPTCRARHSVQPGAGRRERRALAALEIMVQERYGSPAGRADRAPHQNVGRKVLPCLDAKRRGGGGEHAAREPDRGTRLPLLIGVREQVVGEREARRTPGRGRMPRGHGYEGPVALDIVVGVRWTLGGGQVGIRPRARDGDLACGDDAGGEQRGLRLHPHAIRHGLQALAIRRGQRRQDEWIGHRERYPAVAPRARIQVAIANDVAIHLEVDPAGIQPRRWDDLVLDVQGEAREQAPRAHGEQRCVHQPAVLGPDGLRSGDRGDAPRAQHEGSEEQRGQAQGRGARARPHHGEPRGRRMGQAAAATKARVAALAGIKL